jgi:hypothetical protein
MGLTLQCFKEGFSLNSNAQYNEHKMGRSPLFKGLYWATRFYPAELCTDNNELRMRKHQDRKLHAAFEF